MCRGCQFRYNHPRRGTGAAYRISRGGYVLIMVDGKERYQHRFIMETALGRKLAPREHVHHKDGNPQNNSLDNLELLPAAEHHRAHMTPDRAKAMSAKGHAARWRNNAPAV